MAVAGTCGMAKPTDPLKRKMQTEDKLERPTEQRLSRRPARRQGS
ncbi:hypothetical protein COLO4_07765 [Corchorus olitorius]|uniref:Uncharacterized protein n=1 Tax=Corchorus olitorius TaxID=93759 RepID=A0A1R3KIZ5_9ROSI|nr:hypothetical protein COLO4_07765 [Corchorus olitorius]